MAVASEGIKNLAGLLFKKQSFLPQRVGMTNGLGHQPQPDLFSLMMPKKGITALICTLIRDPKGMPE